MATYWLFLAGLAHFVFALVVGKYAARRYRNVPWVWLLIFALSMGVLHWLILIKAILVSSFVLYSYEKYLIIISYISVVEFNRRSFAQRQLRLKPLYVYGPVVLAGVVLYYLNTYLFSVYFFIFVPAYTFSFPVLFSWNLNREYPKLKWLVFVLNVLIIGYAFTFILAITIIDFTSLDYAQQSVAFLEKGKYLWLIRGILIYFFTFSLWSFINITDRKYSRKLKYRVLGIPIDVFAAVIISVIFISGWFFNNYFFRLGVQEVKNSGFSRASLVATLINDEIITAQRAVKGISQAYNIRKALLSPSKQNIERGNKVLDRYNHALNAAVCYVMDTTGLTIMSSNRHSSKSFVGKNYSFRPYFKEAIQGKMGNYFAVGVTSQKPGFYASYPIYNKDKIIGVMVMKRDFSKILMDNDFVKTPTFLVNPDGIIFLSNLSEYALKSLWPLPSKRQEELIRTRQFGNHTFLPLFETPVKNGALTQFKGKHAILLKLPIRLTNWKLVSLEPLTTLTRYQFFIYIILLAISAISIIFLMILEQTSQMTIQAQQSEEEFKLLIESAPEAIFLICAEKMMIKLVNHQATKMLNYQKEELLDKNFSFVFKSNFEIFKKEVAAANEEKNVAIKDIQFLTKGGRLVEVEGRATKIIRDEREHYIVFLRDVTKEKQIQREIIENEKKYRNIFDNASDAIILLSGGKIIDCNSKAAEIFGTTRDELIGSIPQEYLPEFQPTGSRSLDLFIEHFTKTLQGEMSRFSCQYLRKDHTPFDAEVSLSRVELKGETVVQAIIRDVTEQKELERSLKIARDKALETARMKSEFLANMSHEIRTPMNGVIGMLDLLSSTQLDDEQRDFVETAKISAESLLTIINDILDFSKIEAGKLEIEEVDIDLRSVVENVGETLAKPAHDKGIEFIVYVDKEVPRNLKGDPVRLRQVLINFANNAVKFTEKGEVIVSCTVHRKEKDQIWLKFMVKDTGIGIPKDKQKRIFEAFQQADGSTTRKYGGTGLGLAISKQLIDMMHGQLELESEPGKGSIFTFYLPFSYSEKQENDIIEYQKSVEGKRVLVVDDNATNRRILEQMLSNFKLIVATASNGKEGMKKLAQAQRRGKPYQLLLLDVQMPEMDGREMLEKLKKEGYLSYLKVIVLSSSGDPSASKWFKQNGATDFLYKPVKQRRLLETIQKVTALRDTQVETPVKQEQTPEKQEKPETEQRKARILLVEDNLINQKVAMRMLSNAGYEVEIANNGREAVNKVFTEEYDLVLMDVQMPEMDGIEATLAIRNQEQGEEHIPIIAMTAHAMKGDRERCLAAGMDDYISKPIQKKEMEAKIQSFLQQKIAV